jgi:hypothetical protein
MLLGFSVGIRSFPSIKMTEDGILKITTTQEFQLGQTHKHILRDFLGNLPNPQPKK